VYETGFYTEFYQGGNSDQGALKTVSSAFKALHQSDATRASALPSLDFHGKEWSWKHTATQKAEQWTWSGPCIATFQARFSVAEAGEHRFRLAASEASQLFIDDHMWIDKNGADTMEESRYMSVGHHEVRVKYVHSGEEVAALKLEWNEGKGGELVVFKSMHQARESDINCAGEPVEGAGAVFVMSSKDKTQMVHSHIPRTHAHFGAHLETYLQHGVMFLGDPRQSVDGKANAGAVIVLKQQEDTRIYEEDSTLVAEKSFPNARFGKDIRVSNDIVAITADEDLCMNRTQTETTGRINLQRKIEQNKLLKEILAKKAVERKQKMKDLAKEKKEKHEAHEAKYAEKRKKYGKMLQPLTIGMLAWFKSENAAPRWVSHLDGLPRAAVSIADGWKAGRCEFENVEAHRGNLLLKKPAECRKWCRKPPAIGCGMVFDAGGDVEQGKVTSCYSFRPLTTASAEDVTVKTPEHNTPGKHYCLKIHQDSFQTDKHQNYADADLACTARFGMDQKTCNRVCLENPSCLSWTLESRPHPEKPICCLKSEEKKGRVHSTIHNSGIPTRMTTVGGSPETLKYVMGGEHNRFNFGAVVKSTFTICSITRLNGIHVGNVLHGSDGNWSHGHDKGKAGLARYGDWAASQPTDDAKGWLVMCGQNGQNGGNRSMVVNSTTVTKSEGGSTGSQQLGINMNEDQPPSEWAVAEVMLWDKALSAEKMQVAAQYLTDRVQLGLHETGSFIGNNKFALAANEEQQVDDTSLGMNLAIGKPTAQSSTVRARGIYGDSSRAVDGGFSNLTFSAGSCTHTADQVHPWWRVDLQNMYKVSSVTVYNRGDAHGDRLNFFEIRIGEDMLAPASNEVCGSSGLYVKENGYHNEDCNDLNGQYVFVLSQKQAPLTLCEVRVYGEIDPSAAGSGPKGPGQWYGKFWADIDSDGLSLSEVMPKDEDKPDIEKEYPILLFKRTEAVWEGLLNSLNQADMRFKDYFGARFSIKVAIKTAGKHTFVMTSSDGSRLMVDGAVVVDNDGLHGMRKRYGSIVLERKTVQIGIEYFEKEGGSGLIVLWRGPEGTFGMQPVPHQHLGYRVRMWSALPGPFVDIKDAVAATKGYPHALEKSVPAVEFTTDRQRQFWHGFDKRFTDSFVAVIDGYLRVPKDSKYTFYAQCDDACEIFVGGLLVLSNKGDANAPGCRVVTSSEGASVECERTTQLESGFQTLKINYYQNDKSKLMIVKWAGKGVTMQVLRMTPKQRPRKKKSISFKRTPADCRPSFLMQDKKDKKLFRRHYRNYISCEACTEENCPSRSDGAIGIIRRMRAGTVHLAGKHKDGKYRIFHHVLPLEPYTDGHFGERERWVQPDEGILKQMAMFDHNFQVDIWKDKSGHSEGTVIIGDPRQYGNIKETIVEKEGTAVHKQVGKFSEAGAVFVVRFTVGKNGSIEFKEDSMSKQCYVHKYPRMRLGYGRSSKVQTTLAVFQTVQPEGYNEVLDMAANKKALLIATGPRAFNGNLLVSKKEGEAGVVAMVNPGHSVSVMYKPNSIDFKRVSHLIVTNGYLCADRPQPLLCDKVLEDITIKRNFFDWQTSSSGRLASVLGTQMEVEGFPDVTLDVEFMKKVVKFYSESDQQNAAGRMEKAMMCATLRKKSKDPKAAVPVAEQCCVLKRGCGDGEGTIDNEYCNPPTEEMRNPVKAF